MSSEIIPSSIIQFSVANFGCFRDRVDFSMAGRKDGKNTFLLHQTGDQLFTAAIIYGPNASGKSTLIEALYFMKAKIKHSIVSEHIEKTIFSPLESNKNTRKFWFLMHLRSLYALFHRISKVLKKVIYRPCLFYTKIECCRIRLF